MQPGTIIWDDKVRGFNARRQFSEVVTFSVYFRTQEGQQRFFKIGRYPVFTPTRPVNRPYASFRDVALGKDPSAERQELRSAPTVSELCDDYAKDMQSEKVNGKKESTIKSDLIRINAPRRKVHGPLPGALRALGLMAYAAPHHGWPALMAR